jgi:VanZ family protein
MKWLITTAVIVLTILLFVGNIDHNGSRILKQLWQCGHFVLFAGFVFILCQHPRLKKMSLLKLLIGIGFISLGFGLLTELLQTFVGRQFEVTDLINDLLGGYAGLLFSRLNKNQSIKTNLSLLFAVVILTAIGFRDLAIAAIDEYNSNQSFPTLSDFEAPFELQRWQNYDSSITINHEFVRTGKQSMQIDFYPSRYPTINFHHFRRDWRHFKNLKFSVYNPSQKNQTLILKVFDVIHPRSNYAHNDRFNTSLLIKPGWNDFEQPLAAINQAPKDRKMEMQAILRLSLFMVDVKKTTTLYLDDLKLSD